ncbi:aminotransferase class IV [Desulfovermiculus halophilus]|uniref:aminotransferase class IV n=1 Tax=Desulfovermiculus halophilus TaxID=339722 RepID=UPI000480BF09|nr:aminotransferase class IV [Desulfovermiculus halophilus]
MPELVSTEDYIQRLLTTSRPGLEDILAFYDHRVGVLAPDPRLMLIPLDDHLVHRGDGVFETLKFEHGRMYQLDAHLQRMQGSSRSIYVQPPCSWKRVRELTLEVAASAGTASGLVSLFIGRGPGGLGIDFRECLEPSLYIVVRRLNPKPKQFWEQGATAVRVTTPAKQGYLSQIKSVDYLPNVLMKREAVLQGADFPLCFDQHGYLAEGATENVCLVSRSGDIVVPEFRQALRGTTLMRALELTEDTMPVVFRPVHEQDILDAREVIVLGTSFDAASIVRYNGQPIHDVRPGPVAERMRQTLQKDLLENGCPLAAGKQTCLS